MGRRRKDGASWLPVRVYAGKSAYEFRPKGGGCIKLAPLSARPAVVIRRHDEEVRKLEMVAGSVSQLMLDMFESAEFGKLAASTQKKYREYAQRLEGVFGKMSANSVKPQHIRRFMDLRGQKSIVAANRELALLSKVFGWAYERGLVKVNPCKGVKKFTEKARDRYITEAEYSAVYGVADPVTQAAMEISYCCAARQGDVLALTRQQLTEQGVDIRQGKTGKRQINAWTPRLRAAVDQALAQASVSSIFVFANEKGQRLSGNTLRNRWSKIKKEAAERYPDLRFDFTFHDIKAMGISDWEGDKQKFSGHKSAQMVAIYDRKPEVVGSHE